MIQIKKLNIETKTELFYNYIVKFIKWEVEE